MAIFQTTQTLPQSVDYIRILPEIVLSIFGMIIMLLDPVMDERRSQRTLGLIALAGTIVALAATVYQAQVRFWGLGFFGMVKVDAFSVFFHFVVISVTLLVILSSYEYMEVQQIRAGEYYGLILFGAVGMALMSSAMELVLIFIALEISSISTYILAGFRRRSAISSESSVKYFLLGSFATAFFLYGVALMFGATGSTSIDRISTRTGGVLRHRTWPAAGLFGRGADVRRTGFQSGRGTLSRLDPGRLRGSAIAGGWIHVYRAEGRCFRGFAAHHF